MNLTELTYQHYNASKSERAFLLLHGISEGINSGLIRSIFTALSNKKESVLAINWPYIDCNQKPSEDLAEERLALSSAVNFLESAGYTQINIIAKSLGGIVTSRWLPDCPQNLELTVDVLGYVIGDVNTVNLNNRLKLVIQGEYDRFGNGSAVSQELLNNNVKAQVIEVAKADHSYRDQLGNPTYQQEVVELLMSNI